MPEPESSPIATAVRRSSRGICAAASMTPAARAAASRDGIVPAASREAAPPARIPHDQPSRGPTPQRRPDRPLHDDNAVVVAGAAKLVPLEHLGFDGEPVTGDEPLCKLLLVSASKHTGLDDTNDQVVARLAPPMVRAKQGGGDDGSLRLGGVEPAEENVRLFPLRR